MYPTHPQVIELPDSFGDTFDMEDFFNYLLENKVTPSPRKRYRANQRVISLGRTGLPKTTILKLKEEGLITTTKKGYTTYIIKDNLWEALKKYLKLKSVKLNLLSHCKAA